MDLDAFVAVHGAEWDRLDRLSRRRRLSGEEADELVRLYRRAATHLSVVRSSAPDPALAARLSRTVAVARAAVAGGHEPLLREFERFVTVSFPAAVWRARRPAIGAAVLGLLLALAAGIWVVNDPRVEAALGTPEEIRQLVEVDFRAYYSEYAAGSFAAKVWTNNAWVTAQCIALGVTGIGPLYVLVFNFADIGVVGGLMASHDRLGVFFALIVPHGLLELTCVFVACGAGWRLFWAWIDPGPLPRGRAMAREGRAMITVSRGLVVVLAVSGVVEAFVTPSPLPTSARIAIGATVWLAFLGYVRHFGRRAVLAGETGDLAAPLAGDTLPVA